MSEPPSATKSRLIRRYLELLGVQHQIDTGSFLERHALPGGPLWQADKPEELAGAVEAGMAALRKAYDAHRPKYQQAYESHVNWEFTEAELVQIVAFLERPVGKHFLDGRWRMEAYVGTDTEQLEEQIVKGAIANMANVRAPLEWKDLPAICRSTPPENSDLYEDWLNARQEAECEKKLARLAKPTSP